MVRRKNVRFTALTLITLASIAYAGWSLLTYKAVSPHVRTPIGSIRLEVADTDEKRAQGLGGRDSLDLHQGMLFVFEQAHITCFWMEDMKFPLDIVWMDENHTILATSSDISPDTYPETFCPKSPAKYAIEVNANQAEAFSWDVGDKLSF